MNQNRRSAKLSPAQIKKLLIILALVAAVLTALVLVLRTRVKQQFGREEEQQVLSASVTTGSISSSVYGSGLLADEDVEQLDIPGGADVEKLYVSRGEKVAEGQLLASVEQNSVVTAMAAVSQEIASLDESIASAMDQTTDTLISSSVSGRVKKIYAQYGDDVASVMLDQGALMLLSLDGYMAVDLETDRLSPGDSLTVTDSSGRSYTGTVEKVLDTTATVLITDKDPQYGDTVQLTDAGGESLGSGTLYIHDPMKVMGYTGTVSSVYTSENAQIYSGSSLLGLSDAQDSASYAGLLKQRGELEDTLAELLRIYQQGGICAPFSGTVKEISVTDVVGEKGALLLLSLDGKLAVDVPAGSLGLGQRVMVGLSDGSALPGTVSQVADGVATVTLSDETAPYDDPVTLTDEAGQTLGSGRLYIHSQVKITGYAGVVETLYVGLNALVTQGQSLLSLSDTGYTGNYNSLLAQRRELEEQMHALFAAWQTGEFCAQTSGCVTQLIAPDESPSGLAFVVGSGSVALLSNEEAGDASQADPTSTPTPSASPDPGPDTDPPSQPPEEEETVKYLAQVTAVTEQEDGSRVLFLSLSDGSSLTLTSAELEGLTGAVPVNDIQAGDILTLCYSKAGQILSVTVYKSSENGQGGINIPSQEPSGSGGMGGNSKYTVTVTLPRTENMLTGMTANVTLDLETRRDVLCIPLAALQEDASGLYVYTGYNKRAGQLTDPVPVTTGASDGEKVEILSGLAAGDSLYYRYASGLKYSFQR